MSQPVHPHRVNQVQLHRPPCSKCGTLTQLARVEPSDDPSHDLRTFECVGCSNLDVAKVRFK